MPEVPGETITDPHLNRTAGLLADATQARTVLDAIEDPIAVWAPVHDDAGEVVDFVYDYINPACAVMLELPVDRVVGRRVSALFPRIAASNRFRLYLEAAATGRSDAFQDSWFYGSSAGRQHEVKLSCVGEYIVSIARDVSEREQAVAELRRAALERAEAATAVAVADERERIATELHQSLVRELFDASLNLHVAATVADDAMRDRLTTAIEQLDNAITMMRAAVFPTRQRVADADGEDEEVRDLQQ